MDAVLKTLLVLFAGGLLYFLPAIAAYERRHRNAAAIFLVDLLLGWTVLGWIVALVWSFTANVAAPPPRAMNAPRRFWLFG
jgi:hypothetical protein